VRELHDKEIAMTPVAFAPNLGLAKQPQPSGISTASPASSITPLYTRLPGLKPAGDKNSRSGWKWLLATAILATLFAARQPWKTVASTASVAANGHTAGEVAKVVSIATPARASAASVALPATLRPWQSTTLHARVSGYLAAWHRDLGARVKAGELLAEIETPELDQELAEGIALAHEAEAAVTQATTEKTESEADLKVAEAQLVRAEAEAALAQSQLVRREQLFSKNVITREEYDTFRKDVDARQADVAAVKSDVARRQANLQTRAATINARQATANSRGANVERLRQLQIFKKIVAPFDGVVTRRSAEVGMLVTAGKESLFTLEDTSRIRVQVNVPQTYALQTVPGGSATLSVPESSSQPATATITRVADSVDSNNRTMLAEIELDNRAHRYQPGSYAQVALSTSQVEQNWTIPTNTLSMRVDGPHVALVDNQNRVEIKPVSLGRDYGRSIVVLDGIRGNERLIINPSDSLSSGLRVQVETKGIEKLGVALTSPQLVSGVEGKVAIQH
jgi:multidrug efflux pump subunit AcrA (membrane-fusion protein)